jgi:glycosyltransferase involved in cell wall biosynthesis
MRTVSALGDVSDVNTWSSIPYFFYKAGEKAGIFDAPWTLKTNQFKVSRFFWNAYSFLTTGDYGGYQYSNHFLGKAERSVKDTFKASHVITFSQHFPRAQTIHNHGGKLFHYIDATLLDLFRSPSYGYKLPQHVKSKAIEVEKDNYCQSEAVVTMATWAKDSLISEYGVKPEKIHTILPGANIELPGSFTFFDDERRPGKERNFVLGFVGKDWQRKGLPLLNQVKDILLNKYWKVELRIIGKAPHYIVSDNNTRYLGFIKKQCPNFDFVGAIAQCDLGCLFSAEEALGISTLEFLRVGVPVVGFDRWGLQDTLLQGASLRFNPAADACQIAEELETFLSEPEKLVTLRKKAREYSDYVTWERCVQEWKEKIFSFEHVRT